MFDDILRVKINKKDKAKLIKKAKKNGMTLSTYIRQVLKERGEI